MSQNGTHPEYERGWNIGYDEAVEDHAELVAACRDLIEQWDKGNLSIVVQRIAAQLEQLS